MQGCAGLLQEDNHQSWKSPGPEVKELAEEEEKNKHYARQGRPESRPNRRPVQKHGASTRIDLAASAAC